MNAKNNKDKKTISKVTSEEKLKTPKKVVKKPASKKPTVVKNENLKSIKKEELKTPKKVVKKPASKKPTVVKNENLKSIKKEEIKPTKKQDLKAFEEAIETTSEFEEIKKGAETQQDFFDSLSGTKVNSQMKREIKKKVVAFKNFEVAKEGVRTSHDHIKIDPNRTNTKIKGKITLPNKLTILRLFLVIPFVILFGIPLLIPGICQSTAQVSYTYITSVPSYFKMPLNDVVDPYYLLRLLCFLGAGIIFIVAMITDYFDGRIARKHDLVTSFGKVFDPIADKVMVLSALIILSIYGIVPIWLTAVIIVRDIIVDGMRMTAANNGQVVPATKMAKWKTMLLSVGIILLIFVTPIWSIDTTKYVLFSPTFPGVFGISNFLHNSYYSPLNLWWLLNWILMIPMFGATYCSIHSGISYFKKLKPYLEIRTHK